MYFDTPSLDECKQYAILNKTTRDDRLFLRFLVRFEMMGYYIMHRVLKGCPCIRRIDMEDVKHTVILGILRAFNTVRDDERPEYLPLRVISYVRNELNCTYRYVKLEGDKIVDMDMSQIDSISSTAVHPKLDALMFATSDMFTDNDRELLHRKYVMGQTHIEISRGMGTVDCNVVRRRLHKLKEMVAQYLIRDGESVKKKINSVTTAQDTNNGAKP